MATLEDLEARTRDRGGERTGVGERRELVMASRGDERRDGDLPEALEGVVVAARLEVFEGGHAFLDQDAGAWPALAAFLSSGE